ncbi:hypothetical protein ACWOA4_09315 [Pediococcus pentosaceus]|uniref:hypothetical protein n=1 Tax=Pediococcus pentosaceus TaxID=1255 RepID=UPI00132FB4D0|nr:hypothetical protein [Pediococcus pentosaceus]KAF0350552.1 hypothetical protein GBO26_05925 [Pediococcus pentosaceus]
MASNNIQEVIRGTVRGTVKETINKLCESELQETKKYDSCRYCHEPFLSLGLAKDIDSEAIVYLNVLRESNIIKFCPVCGRDLSIESYKDMLKEARDKAIEQLNTQSDETQEK